MEIKCSMNRKAVILFSADQTTTEIEFSLGKHRPWGQESGPLAPEQESVSSLGRKRWGIGLGQRNKRDSGAAHRAAGGASVNAGDVCPQN